ncbi:MAG: HAMP domain-containing protein [Acidobacteria bacterium]|nr:MAG: HAMP domain-containing protein [Acidobacteriota bacterium]GIU82400.1 MAG: PAS domain-containing sensor histidine kinase [Pyrinomonadaceae bacterium]
MERKQTKSKKYLKLLVLGIISFLLLITLVLLQASNLWKEIIVETATDTLILYALSSLNFIAFVIFAFIFVRNLLKLLRERKALQLGSKIKTRLLFYFFAVSLLPITAMSLFSYLFMNRAIERWFTNIPENVVRSAREVQQEVFQNRVASLKEKAQLLVYSLENTEINDEKLTELAQKMNLAKIVCLSKDNRILAQSHSTEEANAKIAGADFSSSKSVFQNTDGQLMIVENFTDGRKLLIIPSTYSGENLNQIAENALKEFDRLKAQQTMVRQIGLSTLGLLTFLLIFASSWVAFYVARGLTVPIKALAEGAGEIAQGNLSHRVNVLAEDELAILVDSFNQMASKLQANAEELQQRRRYIETVLESLSTGVISLDSENRLATINKAARQILKLETGDFRGLKLSELLSADNLEVFDKIIKRAKRAGKAFEQTTIYSENPNGQKDETNERNIYPVALTATLLPDGGIVLVIEDLTELLAAQRAAAWSEVARRMAHEIKNPLTPIQLSAERIRRKFLSEIEKSDSQNQLKKIIEESTETILSEVKSLKSMVDEFSKFAKLPDIKLENGNLNDVVKRVISLYEDRSETIEIKASLDERLPNCMIDKEQMKQALVNLIENAIEAFDGEQGEKTVCVTTEFDEKQGKIFIEVADNAKGISPKDIPRLFQPYFSTKGRGTGLGLVIVHRIVSEHGGKIRVAKNFPKGTRFIIELQA